MLYYFRMRTNFHYRNISCRKMTEKDIQDCSNVFSDNYGNWSNAALPSLAGKAIRLLPSRIRSMFIDKPDRSVALMYDGEKLIGQAFYLRRPCPWEPGKSMTFILQLVLVKQYRGHRLGLKLLQSVFGLSDDACWGLFTSNPLTIRALEDATFRHISIPTVEKHVEGLKQVLSDVFDGTSWLDTFHDGCVDTRFAVNHQNNDSKIKKAYPNGGFPFTTPLGPTEEWLAITFHSQPVDFDAAALRIFTGTSREVLRDAYSRMDVAQQAWSQYAVDEVAFLIDRGYVKSTDRVLDLGCGIGRHARALADYGCQVHGIDFSSTLISHARRESHGNERVSFECADVLDYVPTKQYDVVLCVYDVIGSSVEAPDNQRIVDVISRALKPSGVAIVSVMNRELVDSTCREPANRVVKMSDNGSFRRLVELPPSTTMQDSGEIFNPQLMILEASTGVVYRKEQFNQSDLMPVEYVIVDKRYTRQELMELFHQFETVCISCVNAGGWKYERAPTDPHAKEVLGVFKKQVDV